MSQAPARPDRLIGSAWTRVDEAWGYRHWEVVARDGDAVIVAAVLARACQHRLPWRALRDRAIWHPGWQPIVGAGPAPETPADPGA